MLLPCGTKESPTLPSHFITAEGYAQNSNLKKEVVYYVIICAATEWTSRSLLYSFFLELADRQEASRDGA